MRMVLCLCLLAAVGLAGCKTDPKAAPYVPMPADMETSVSTPEKTLDKTADKTADKAPAKTAQ
jgi:hypothetical protein